MPTNRSRAEKTKENDDLGVEDVSGRSSQLASKIEDLFPSSNRVEIRTGKCREFRTSDCSPCTLR